MPPQEISRDIDEIYYTLQGIAIGKDGRVRAFQLQSRL